MSSDANIDSSNSELHATMRSFIFSFGIFNEPSKIAVTHEQKTEAIFTRKKKTVRASQDFFATNLIYTQILSISVILEWPDNITYTAITSMPQYIAQNGKVRNCLFDQSTRRRSLKQGEHSF